MNAGAGTPTTYIECFEWFIAPTNLANQNPDPGMAPDVINNSWGCPPDEGCNTGNFPIMKEVVERVRTAGIFVAVSAGNDGSACSTVTTPAAIYDAVFSVGSTTSSDAASSFSSRGPVTVDGSNRMKPDISAPGSGVRSSIPGGGYTSLSGTSMAGPHVAGLVGLLVSAVPAAAGNIDLLEDVIRQSAVHPTATSQVCGGVDTNVFPNNTFGAGRIDALAAVNLLLSQADFQTAVTPASQAVCAPANALFDIAVDQLGDFPASDARHQGQQLHGRFLTNPVAPPGTSLMAVTTTVSRRRLDDHRHRHGAAERPRAQ
jgi:subtilisin family serine protease